MEKFKYKLVKEDARSIFVTVVTENRQQHPGRLPIELRRFLCSASRVRSERTPIDAQRVRFLWRTQRPSNQTLLTPPVPLSL